MNRFTMELDTRGEVFFNQVVNKLIKLFDIPDIEAIGRINRAWGTANLKGNNLLTITHEDEEYWAKTLYYGKDSGWWLREGEKIEPTPYP